MKKLNIENTSTKSGRGYDILREEMDEETSEGSNDSGNVSEDKEDKDDNLSDGEIWERPSSSTSSGGNGISQISSSDRLSSLSS